MAEPKSTEVNLQYVNRLAVSSDHSMVIADDGFIYTWGSNYYRQLGNTDDYTNSIARPIKSLINIVCIAAGCNYSLAVDVNGIVYSWGRNEDGELGLGHFNSPISEPTRVPTCVPIRITQVSAYYTSMALSESGQMYTWGNNVRHGLGHSFDKKKVHTPQCVTICSDAIAKVHTSGCISGAVTTKGHVYLWGTTHSKAYDKALCLKPKTISRIPNISDATDIAIGEYHVLILLKSGLVYSIGFNGYGCLGLDVDGTYGQGVVDGLRDVVSIHAGFWSSFAIDRQGHLFVWGKGEWVDEFSSSKPLQLTGKYLEFASKRYHSLAILAKYTLCTGGSNKHGESSKQELTFKNHSRILQTQSSGNPSTHQANKPDKFSIKVHPSEELFKSRDVVRDVPKKFGHNQLDLDILENARELIHGKQRTQLQRIIEKDASINSTEDKSSFDVVKGDSSINRPFKPSVGVDDLVSQQSWKDKRESISGVSMPVVPHTVDVGKPSPSAPVVPKAVTQPLRGKVEWVSILILAGIDKSRAPKLGSMLNETCVEIQEITGELMKVFEFTVVERGKVIKYKNDNC